LGGDGGCGAASGEHEKAEGEVLFLCGGGGGGIIGGDGGGGREVLTRALGTLLLDPVIQGVKRGVVELERGVRGGG